MARLVAGRDGAADTFGVEMNAGDSGEAQAVGEGSAILASAASLLAGMVQSSIGHIQTKSMGIGDSMCSDRTHLVCARWQGTAFEPGHIADTVASGDSCWAWRRREGRRRVRE